MPQMQGEHERRMLHLISLAQESGVPFVASLYDASGKLLNWQQDCREAQCDPTAEATILCIRAACQQLRTLNLPGAALYATCEPSAMAATACASAGVDIMVFGAVGEDDVVPLFPNYYSLSVRPRDLASHTTATDASLRILEEVCRAQCKKLLVQSAGK